MHQKCAPVVIVIFFLVIFFALSQMSLSWLGAPYYEQRTCSDTWGMTCSNMSFDDDAFDFGGACNGQQVGGTLKQHVNEVYLNQSYALFGQTVSVTCEYYQYWWTDSYRDEQYVFYYNGSAWAKIAEWQSESSECGVQGYCLFNKTAKFTVNASVGTQAIRCIIDYEGFADNCADESPAKTYSYYDNDDVNFTAVKPLMNATSFELSVPGGSNAHRTQNITAYMQWNKEVSESYVWHNGTGSDEGFFIASPYTGNWTNYTLNLMNTSEFKYPGFIKVETMFARDSYEQEVGISGNKYFYLWSGANITYGELSSNITYNATQVNFSCAVFDNYTNLPVQGYNVSFFRNGTFLSDGLTDSTGVAKITSGTGLATPPENWTYKCNITDMPSVYYNASFEQSAVLQIVDLGASIAPIDNTGFGSGITILANVTGNATLLTSVKANISYYNYSREQYDLDEVSLSAITTHSQTNTEYSANYTPKTAGMHNVTVQAVAEQHPDDPGPRTAQNTTSFEVSGWANISDISLSKDTIYNGTSTSIFCRVANNYSGLPVASYNVSFFNTTNYLGMVQANSTGWANMTYNDYTESPPATEILKCNITGMPERSYNASSEIETTLQIVDLGINLYPIANADFGNNITIKFNVTGNATPADPVVASVKYYNYSSNNYTIDTVDLTSITAHSATNTEYSGIYATVQSGPHEALITAYADRSAANTTFFNVSYGTPVASFVFPNFRILVNQSFALNVTVTASGGDIVNPALILNFTNDSMMNISSGESYAQNIIANITNGSAYYFSWNTTTNELGLLRATVNITTEDSTSLLYDTPYSVLLPITSASPTETNITGTETLTVKIVGNTTDIVAANFTVEKPYSGGSEFFSGNLMAVEEETTCVGIGAETGNVAVGANTSCSDGTCALAVDNNTYTAWLQNTQYKWITINLSQPYNVDALELLWSGTDTNTSVYYKRNYGTESGDIIWVPFNEFMYQDAPTNQNTTFVKAQTPFTTDTILINDSSSVPSGIQIYEVRIYPILGSADKCYIYEANYTSINYSGTHLVSSDVATQSKTGDISSNSNFFVGFGAPQISKSFNSIQFVGNNTFMYGIYAGDGDLRDMDALLSISNTSIINFSSGETPAKNTSFIPYGTEANVYWNLNMTALGNTTLSLFANSTSGLGGSTTYNTSVEVFLEDSTPPQIHGFSLSKNKTNLHQSIIVTVNASDNYQVQNVIAEITTPSILFNQTNSTDPKTSGIWTIEIEPGFINQTGNYSVKVYASDLNSSNIVENATILNITAYAEYTILPDTGYSAYNRGENITFAIYDVNNNPVPASTWIVNETFANNTATIFSGVADEYVYNFSENKTHGTYVLDIYANNSGNSGNYTNNSIFASALLELSFTHPSSESTFQKSTPFDPQPKVLVKNTRGEILNYVVDMNLSCPNAEDKPMTYIADMNYTRSESPLCASSSSAGATFSIIAEASGMYNNTGSASLQLHTYSEEVPPPTYSGGGGGGASTTTIYVNQTTNQSVQYVVQKIHSFNFSISKFETEIMQGRTDSIIASVANTGDFDMFINAQNSDTNVSLGYSRTLFLKKGDAVDFPIRIYANLSQMPGEEIVTIYLSAEGMVKNRAFTVKVIENPDIPEINAVFSDIIALTEKISSYERLTIDVPDIQKLLVSATSHMASAREAYLSGDADALSQAIMSAKKDISTAEKGIEKYDSKKLIAENRYVIATGILTALVLFDMLYIFFIPYFSISSKLFSIRRKERFLVEARKAGEIQYFSRKINEATFQKIMTEDQHKLYGLKTEERQLEEELALLTKLNLKKLGKVRDEWMAKAHEAEKAKAIGGVKRSSLTEMQIRAFSKKSKNIFRSVKQKISSIFKRN